MRKPKITVIGGGTGIPVILKSLREKDVEIAAIVTVADDGGSDVYKRQIMDMPISIDPNEDGVQETDTHG